MEKMVHAERGICELEVFQFGEKGRAAPLFHTWSTQQFGEEEMLKHQLPNYTIFC